MKIKIFFLLLFLASLGFCDSIVMVKDPQVISNGRYFAVVGLKHTHIYQAISSTEMKKLWSTKTPLAKNFFLLSADGKHLIETEIMPLSTTIPVIRIHSKTGTKKMYMESFIEDERKIQRTVTMFIWLKEKTILKGDTIIVASRDKTLTVDYVKGKILKKEDTKGVELD